MNKLTIKQEKFALKYFECGNASEAYRHAFSASKMKDETVWNKSSLLLKQDKVRARLDELRAKAEEESQWTVDKLIKAHTRIIAVGMGDEATNHIVTNGIGDRMSETINMQMYDTNLSSVKASLVEIGKLLEFYTSKLEVDEEFSLKDFTKILYDEKQKNQVELKLLNKTII